MKQLLRIKHPGQLTQDAQDLQLHRTLGPWGLTALGIGAVIGGGIFVITGQAAAQHAGPAIMLSFVLAALCCTFCALAYAEFAAMVPVSGSAYTYTYATLGEAAAWFIGWMLVLEYGVSASAVAVSWTGYFLSLLDQFGIHLPAALVSAPLDGKLQPTGAIANLPAAAIVLLLTWLCYVGIRKSSAMNMAMVVLKTCLILLVIFAGWKYVDPANWHPFIPEAQGPGKFGWDGVVRGAAIVFFAYIGFEAVSVAAQESTKPQRDLPVGMLASLVICTVLYIAMAAVMTGLVPYSMLGTDEPVVTAVAAHPELGWLRLVVEIGALIGLSSVVLVMIIGQPRIFMIMARDGLLPTVFTRIHPKYRTPHINTVITGIGIAVLAAVFPLDVLGELTSMGTLIAFASVCAGVLILRRTQPQLPRPFRIPFAWAICLAGIGSCLLLLSTMTAHNWMLMVIWTVIGFVIYAAYGFRHSRLRGQG
ncbi:amino acid permease [Pseudoxanthomonas winnipegensis]|uniref:APA family basic amino acid/polyamine antiporter n=1 Tax=Pseudoxanthomonas winnipegensis TaxID=2480810 RepID=A0AAW8GBI2_9GAMM|nr:amino acid permease [Pseudoxanthomonas winnipegensis]MDR6137566.1 APA family basic amino acid/polyamine antiporter [Pseudoxanthomonas sp. SORGH_AS_0997]MDQ1119232.1 APA family basic amino acid/polyamine antiporter [Pseudoxanthomonas winnipegensis]MDQ1132424.1 APA family basic amino acid/polyamine antiporter [Pseudoxanthomonas winnipegensis]TAA08708.1 amino acid permease [Pseudoxanthomonas winnipegensis]TAA17075.1 amino acid permease [Pseudoxanthomonas winnipegensis]